MEEEGGASGGGTRSKKNDTTSDKSFSGAKFSIYDLKLIIIILCAVPSTLVTYKFFIGDLFCLTSISYISFCRTVLEYYTLLTAPFRAGLCVF
jgi:hypothetical protein